MKKYFTASLLTAVFAFAAFAQLSSAQCPKTSLYGPSDDVAAGAPITFTANVSGGDPNGFYTYNWSVSAGTISSGQGTPSIIVDSTELGGQSVTATVELGGTPPECDRTASWTASVKIDATARKSDEYGNIKLADEKARLDNFAIELQNDPTSQGYVIAYGGRKSKPGAAKTALKTVTTYLVKTRRLDASRVITLDGGYKEEPSRELWIVPSGAMPPTASPSVDPSEVKSPKKAKRKAGKKKS